jgi:hypothetical protein
MAQDPYVSAISIHNSILWNPQAAEEASVGASAQYSLIRGGLPNALYLIDADPLFRDPQGADFSLQSRACGFPANSPAIDRGDPLERDAALSCAEGQKTRLPDLGIYGGDGACGMKIMLAQLPGTVLSGDTLGVDVAVVNGCSRERTLLRILARLRGAQQVQEVLFDGPPQEIAPGETVRRNLRVVIPRTLPLGTYRLEVYGRDADGLVPGEIRSLVIRDHTEEILVPDEVPTIAAALELALDGDEIVLEPGIYREGDLDFEGKMITLRSVDPEDDKIVAATVIDGEQQRRLFRFGNNEQRSSRIEGVTLTRGFAATGGALHIHGASPTLRRVFFLENVASDQGSAVLITAGGRPHFDACRFERNSGRSTICPIEASVDLDLCRFTENGARSDAHWVILTDEANTVMIDRCTFYRNYFGVVLNNFGNAYVEIGNSVIWDSGSPGFGVSLVHHTLTTDYWSRHGETNLNEDPRFCSDACVDPTLAADSPCIGAGEGGITIGSEPVACPAPVPHQPSAILVPAEEPTIRLGIRVACDGDTVRIAPGNYFEAGLYLCGKEICVEGTATANGDHDASDSTTVIDARSMDRVFYLTNGDAQGATLRGLTITGGRVGEPRSYGGGVLILNDSAPTIEHCRIIGNQAHNGGGIWLDSTFDTVVFRNTFFADNNAVEGGGLGVGRDAWNVRISHCTFRNNRARELGGGALIRSNDCSIDNSLFAANQADNGAGIRLRVFSANITNGTFVANRHGSGISLSGSVVTLRDLILWDNSPRQIHTDSAEGTLHVQYCDLEGGWSGPGNLDLDPRFSSEAPGRFLLSPLSPCIDAGDPQLEDNIYDWHPRWPQGFADGPRSDMGAYGGPGNGKWLKSP